MKSVGILLLFVCIVSVVISTSDMMREMRKHNELQTKEDKVNDMMNKIRYHCKAVNMQDVMTERGRSDVARAEEQLRTSINIDINDCDDDEATPEPTQLPIDGPCTSPQTVNLTGSWRKDSRGSQLRPASGSFACDRELQNGNHWFRFTGDAGLQLADRCRPAYSCGGHGGFWSNAAMPTNAGDIWRVPIYGSWSNDCNWYTWPQSNSMYVQRCSAREGDFVYKVFGTGSCYWTFCGMDL